MKVLSTLSLLYVLFLVCPAHGQVNKRSLTEDDYKLWSTMSVGQLSDSGNWVSYSLHYESGMDTLFVKHTKTLKMYAYANCRNGQFIAEKEFVCQDVEGQMLITNLVNGTREAVAAVDSYTISNNDQFLILHKSSSELILRDLRSKELHVFPETSTYSYNPVANALIFGSKNSLHLIKFGATLQKEMICTISGVHYSDFVWQENGRSVAYFIDGGDKKIGYYTIQDKNQKLFDISQFANFPKNMELYTSSFTELTISDDGSKVFFGLNSTQVHNISDGVQIWSDEDKSLYPAKKLYDGMNAIAKIGVWLIQDSRFIQLTDNELPNGMLTGNQQYAVVYNPIANEPEYIQNASIDFYIKNITTGAKQLLLTKQSPDFHKLSASPCGKYVAYFKDRCWWIYDVLGGVHSNLTQNIAINFEDENYDRSGEKPSCGLAGWTTNDAELLIYDNYDVWLIKSDGSGFKRLTDGRKSGMQYRILPTTKENRGLVNFSWMQKGVYDLKSGLTLKAFNLTVNEIYQWDLRKGLNRLISTKNRLDVVLISKDKSNLVYTDEHYHQSPVLNVLNKSGKETILFRSNSQQSKFLWGFSKIVTYNSPDGDVLQGALFYPAGYSAKKHYPMVVKVYEKQARYYNQYVNPTPFNDGGFNITNFTSRGYFVLLPDIVYEEGSTGKSAVACVVSACMEVLKNESVDPKRLGLIGHSFGGYETNFIITQTPLFAAAVSGSGVSDYVSDYLNVGWNHSIQNYWRYESDQSRMGVSLFEDRARYERNSPLTFVENITTPLLLWSGINDRTVHYFQGLEFHLALKRLKKRNILLLYENGSHSLKSKEDMVDLTHKMQDWFGYYLKGDRKPDWFGAERL